MDKDETEDTERTAPIERIKQLMRDRGITQQQVADVFGKSLINIKKTLNSNSMTTSNLKKYADLLGVEMWELFISQEEISGRFSSGEHHHCPYCGKPIIIETKVR